MEMRLPHVIVLVMVMVMMVVSMTMIVVTVMMSCIPFNLDIKLHGAQVRTHDPVRFYLVALHGKLLQLGLQIFEIQAEIEERPNRHVAADT